MTWDYRQNLRSVTNHLNLENGRFFISNFMWLNFQNLVARYTGVARLNVRYYFYFDSLLYLLGISTECNRFTGQRFALLVVRAIIGIN